MAWLTLGESAAGTSHRDRNVPCQDAFRICNLGSSGEFVLIVVADGAGSAAHSDIGAAKVCDTIVHSAKSAMIEDVYTGDQMRALIAEGRRALLEEAERLNVGSRELACTAILAVVGPTTGAFAQIGDGAIVVNQAEAYRTVFWPEPAEYANATDFLTDDCFEDHLRFKLISEEIVELAAFTDGLQRLALDFTIRAPHSLFFRPLFDALKAADDSEMLLEPFRAFLESDRVNQRTDDDKTLAIAVRKR